ncbi:MAG TPA: flagellar biosynthesis anti-sigma factor FlgM [Candidatus Binataceae bacterium]|nr:flagellar biosynthesis anti-sigma factor FlgM [Candidatus Binataceae bacterium]
MSNSINGLSVAPSATQLDAAATTAAAPVNGAAPVRDTAGAAGPGPSPSAPADRTTLSPLGLLLGSASSAVASLSSFRSERVMQLRSALADGIIGRT